MEKENFELDNQVELEPSEDSKGLPSQIRQYGLIEENQESQTARWIDNQGNEVKEVFGFNKNAELVNSRAAMAGFLMLILTELVFKGEAATKSIFGIGL